MFLDELTRNIKHDIQILDTLDGFDKKDQVIAEMYFLNNCKKKDIAEKVGNVVQEAEAIKQKAETTYHSAEKLQKNVERFIV